MRNDCSRNVTHAVPKVSIVTVCLNEEGSIGRTITSVLDQTHAEKEYIVIDGGSTDRTFEIVNSFGPNSLYAVSEKDNGIFAAMNKGISMSKGEYIYFLNGGDRFYDANVLTDIFEQNPTEDVLYGDMIFDYGKGRDRKRTQPGRLGYMRFVTTSLWHPATLTKRRLFREFGTFDEDLRICGDYEFFLRVVFDKRVRTRHIPTVFSVFNAQGISRDKTSYLLHYAERKAVQARYLPQPYYALARARHFLIRKKRTLLRQL